MSSRVQESNAAAANNDSSNTQFDNGARAMRNLSKRASKKGQDRQLASNGSRLQIASIASLRSYPSPCHTSSLRSSS